MVEKVGEANSRGAWCASLSCLDVSPVGRGSTVSFKQRGEVERSLEGARPAMKRLYHKLDKGEERRWSRKCCGGGVNRN